MLTYFHFWKLTAMEEGKLRLKSAMPEGANSEQGIYL